MAQQAMAQQARAGWTAPGGASARGAAAPEVAVRLAGALLALAVAAVHVADQGGVTAFNSPDWIGWGYRLIEVGGVLRPERRERGQLRVADDLVAQGEHGWHDDRCPGGTAQCGEAAVALAKPSQGAQVRQSHTRHLR
jgi:hypothetical protein